MNIKLNISNDKWIYPSFFPYKLILKELMRPWKLLILIFGEAWLFYGALFWNYPDWDIGVSIVMSLLTYCIAPWSISMLIRVFKYKNKYLLFYLMIFCLCEIAVVDWSYVIWHQFAGNPIYRYENFIASSYLYFVSGFIWLYRGSFTELISDIKNTHITKKG